jgi:hypothetical protein
MSIQSGFVIGLLGAWEDLRLNKRLYKYVTLAINHFTASPYCSHHRNIVMVAIGLTEHEQRRASTREKTCLALAFLRLGNIRLERVCHDVNGIRPQPRSPKGEGGHYRQRFQLVPSQHAAIALVGICSALCG